MTEEEPIAPESAGDRVPSLVWWLTFLFAVVGVAAVFWAVPHEQDDLRARTEQAVGIAGFSGVEVEFAGRDATLRGVVASQDELDSVEGIVAGIEGVRRVDVAAVTITGDGGGT